MHLTKHTVTTEEEECPDCSNPVISFQKLCSLLLRLEGAVSASGKRPRSEILLLCQFHEEGFVEVDSVTHFGSVSLKWYIILLLKLPIGKPI